ncbi:MAG: pantoate--beta-alanine ligase [Niabella sp.]
MIVFHKAAAINPFLQQQKALNKRIGFVPTMGALHDGHLSLIEQCRQNCDIVVSSIFVNPTQFNDPSDLEKYPRTTEADIQKLYEAGCDVVFLPAVAEIYPPSYKPPHYPLGEIETLLEGAYRPGHFQGVCQVLDRLFEIVNPQEVFFGQKDYQQCMVVKKLLTLVPAHQSIHMHICPIVREADGLAMSSRNRRLSETERQKAVTIYQTMQQIKKDIRPGETAPLVQKATDNLVQAGFKPDYVSIAQASDLHALSSWDGHTALVVLIAAYLGDVRLIDNELLPDSLTGS